MTDKERLEDIDYRKDIDTDGYIVIDQEDYEFLYRQAERVQEMGRENHALKAVATSNKFIGEQYLEQNERYRATINAMGQILKDAIHSLDVGEKVQGLGHGVAMRNIALREESE